MFNSLPTEVKLDIFKCLNYKELYSIKQIHLYFCDFINNYEGELAREKLSRISVKVLTYSALLQRFLSAIPFIFLVYGYQTMNISQSLQAGFE